MQTVGARLKSDFRITVKDKKIDESRKAELIKLLIDGEHKKSARHPYRALEITNHI